MMKSGSMRSDREFFPGEFVAGGWAVIRFPLSRYFYSATSFRKPQIPAHPKKPAFLEYLLGMEADFGNSDGRKIKSISAGVSQGSIPGFRG